MRPTTHTDFRSFYLLNATQFLGALNDNVFKLLVIYLMINVKGPAFANSILAMAGAVFVIPFLLFSSGAGVLADRMSKRTIIVFTKVLELLIMIFGLFAVSFESEVGSYGALFLMATQSALFGPSKYGIIPELVESKKVSKANGSMTSFTYLAIILGTFLASFITHITNKDFVIEAWFCIFIAILGLMTSFGISRTAPQNAEKKINPFFFYEIYETLKLSWKVPHLLPAIYGSSFFLFIGSFTQMNIIPFAMQSLGLSEVGGGYLFLPTAVGIAIGALLAGQLSKDRVEPGISCVAGFFIAFFFFLISLFSHSLTATILLLTLIGIVGGAYLVPFDSFIQVNSPKEFRGQVIAAANFFSFVGVLMAAFFLYWISEQLGFQASVGFAWMGSLTLISNIVVSGRLSSFFLPFFSTKILKRFSRIKQSSPLPGPKHVVILESSSWIDALLLYQSLPRLKILIPSAPFRLFPWVNGFVDSIRFISPHPKASPTLKALFGQTSRFEHPTTSFCLFLKGKGDTDRMVLAYRKIFEHLGYEVVTAEMKKEKVRKHLLFFRYFLKLVTLSFKPS